VRSIWATTGDRGFGYKRCGGIQTTVVTDDPILTLHHHGSGFTAGVTASHRSLLRYSLPLASLLRALVEHSRHVPHSAPKLFAHYRTLGLEYEEDRSGGFVERFEVGLTLADHKV
jgi:hypothetical protein